MEIIPAREACVFWNPGGDVAVARAGGPDNYGHLQKSDGACWAHWQEATAEGLYFRLAQLLNRLIIVHKVDPVLVHNAFLAVPEYRVMLPYDHPDALTDEEAALLEDPLPDFGSGSPMLGT